MIFFFNLFSFDLVDKNSAARPKTQTAESSSEKLVCGLPSALTRVGNRSHSTASGAWERCSRRGRNPGFQCAGQMADVGL